MNVGRAVACTVSRVCLALVTTGEILPESCYSNIYIQDYLAVVRPFHVYISAPHWTFFLFYFGESGWGASLPERLNTEYKIQRDSGKDGREY